MKWRGRQRSSNVDDRRSMKGPAVAGGGLGLFVIALIVYFMGGDPGVVLENAPAARQSSPVISEQESDELAEMVSVVLRETENVWNRKFPQEFGRPYREPTLVLFSGSVESACGIAGAAVGPFYCPPDQKVYIDLSFYRTLRDRLGAPGDFAQAYVIAHEVGHHVQNLSGVATRVRSAQSRSSREDANALSVQMELQADCYAGVWAHGAERTDLLNPGDIQEALNAASAIGDDALQRQSDGTVRPETFTHGTSEQRVSWFRRGYQTGEIGACNTF
ncbi:MAG: neutral zinc metallopeptidase [Thermoanaerobaculia bacterium]|nr:neutral zinc metallopeptidase [Thermoanaerobaculia bacterium]